MVHLAGRRLSALALAMAVLLVGVGAADPAQGNGPTCPAPEGNARAVRFIYLELLDRCPDPVGGAYWTGRLDAGLAPARFAAIVDLSDENLTANNVVPLHRLLLGRDPSAAELANGVEMIRRERGNARLTATLLASEEGYAHVTDEAKPSTPAERDAVWLEAAYARILDRASDPAGRAYHSARLSPGGSTQGERLRVALDLEYSTDNARSWVLASMTEALGRAPDPAGTRYWLAWLTGRGRWQTFTMWTTHLGSPEAYRRAQTQPG